MDGQEQYRQALRQLVASQLGLDSAVVKLWDNQMSFTGQEGMLVVMPVEAEETLNDLDTGELPFIFGYSGIGVDPF